MDYAEKYRKEKDYQREYRRRPEVLQRDSKRRKLLRKDSAYRDAYNKATQARRRKAQHYIRNRVAKGKLSRSQCVFCGKPDGLAHHEDYSKPLSIVWVCHAHHADIHSGIIKVLQEHITHVEP